MQVDAELLIKIAELRPSNTEEAIRDLLGINVELLDAAIQRLKELGEDGFSDKVALVRERKALQHAKRSDKVLVQRILELEDQLSAAEYIKVHRSEYKLRHSKKKKGKSRAVALALLSDWHCEEQVESGTVNGMNHFDKAECDLRVNRYFTHLAKLINTAQKSTQIDTLVLAILGDLISGNIHDELLESCRLRPAEAIVEVLGYLTAGIKYLLKTTNVEIVIPCKVGNHSRITRRVHVSSEEGNSLEWILYNALAKAFSAEKRVEFILGKSYFTYVNLWPNFVLRCSHGHAVRYNGGVGGITIPMRKAIAQWNKARRADLDVVGHWHNMLDLGDVLVNGSLIGYGAFALRIKADYAPPRQVFCLIDESVGKTMTTPIILTEDR